MKKIMVTGAAGFIGFHFAQKLCRLGHEVVALDSMDDYYDVSLKRARLEQLKPFKNFFFEPVNLADRNATELFFKKHMPEIVVHLAAQAGVRYSITHPHAYVDSNIQGFLNILEGCRHHAVERLIYASSSSVYGMNAKLPFSTNDNVDHPVSLYAATKKSNELMAYTYSHLYGLPCTGLRFFTVYGPWGRPDMAYFKFVQAIEKNETIQVFNHGDMKRDFTYIDDIVEAMVRLLNHKSEAYRIYNIGNSKPENLMDFIRCIENTLGKKANLEMLPMQPGDVYATYADISDLEGEIGFRPSTPLEEGMKRFVEWYKDYYK